MMKTVFEGVGGIPRIATAVLFLIAAAPAIAGWPPPGPAAPVPGFETGAAGEVILPPPGPCGSGPRWDFGTVPPGAGGPGCAGSVGFPSPCPVRIVPAAGETAGPAAAGSSGELRCVPVEVDHEL